MEQNYNSDYSYNNPDEAGEKISMFDAWVDALTSPNTETYRELGNARNASLVNGAVWVLIATFIGGIVSVLLSSVFGPSQFDQLTAMLGENGIDMPAAQIGGSVILAGIVCGAPISAISQTLGFLLGSVIENWLANLFGGKGSLDSYTFAYAAFYAPLFMVSTMLSPVPVVGGILSLLFGLYMIVLNFVNLRGVKQLSSGKAILVMLIPGIIVILLFGCLMLVFGSAIIAAMQNSGY